MRASSRLKVTTINFGGAGNHHGARHKNIDEVVTDRDLFAAEVQRPMISDKSTS